MIKDKTLLNFIDSIIVKPLGEELVYYVKLIKGYVFNLTNTNTIECNNPYSINKVLEFGIKWSGFKKKVDN